MHPADKISPPDLIADDDDPSDRDLPDHVADFTLAELDEARNLLGQRARGDELGNKARRKLDELLHTYPSPKVARQWKRDLKELRDELCGELGES